VQALLGRRITTGLSLARPNTVVSVNNLKVFCEHRVDSGLSDPSPELTSRGCRLGQDGSIHVPREPPDWQFLQLF